MAWPYDPLEPEAIDRMLQDAIAGRDHEVNAAKQLICAHTERYRQPIAHGDEVFNAEALVRLAHWQEQD